MPLRAVTRDVGTAIMADRTLASSSSRDGSVASALIDAKSSQDVGVKAKTQYNLQIKIICILTKKCKFFWSVLSSRFHAGVSILKK